MKKVLVILGWSVFLLGSIVLLGFSEVDYNRIAIKELNIDIDKSNGHSFITESQVKEYLSNKGFQLNANSEVFPDLKEIERSIQGLSATKNVEVYAYNNGELHINIKQRNPIARVLVKNGYLSYYIDEDGKVMSLSDTYVARVPVFNGYIKYGDHYKSIKDLSVHDPSDKTLDEIYQLANIINKDEFFRSQIVQVYINKQGEYELIPRVGNQRILFGDITEAEEKFKKLKQFYTNRNSISVKELNMYDTLNIMYSNQIVCSKR